MIKNLKLKIKNSPRVAIYYDWLTQWGGAEKVLLNLLTIFPSAELFTLFHDSQKTQWLPQNIKIHTSFLQNLPRTNILAPIYDIAAESFDFKNFDIVISTTSNVGHCLLTSPNSLFVCYYHNLNRHLYLHPPKLLQPLLNIYKNIDKIYTKRPDTTFCNSKTTQQRLLHHLNLNSKIINPGIDTNYFIPTPKPTNDYFLIVSRMVEYKGIDYAIKTFLNSNKKLIIAGTGRDFNRLKKIANNAPNIIFTGFIDNQKLLILFQNCTALICPQIEDFGLTSIEAQSCGRPVIALDKGGLTETVIDKKTGLFFKYQNQKSLNIALNKFNKINFYNNYIRNHAKSFDQSFFMLNFKQEINKLYG